MLWARRTPLKFRLLFAIVPVLVICGILATTAVGGAEARAPRTAAVWTQPPVAPTTPTTAAAPTTSTTIALPVGTGSPSTSTSASPRLAAGKPAITGPASRTVRRTSAGSASNPLPATSQPQPGSASSPNGITEDFSALPQGLNWTEGSTHGQWVSVFGGFGQTGIESDGAHGNVLSLSPAPSAAPSETHAALVRSAATFADLDLTVDVRTLQQLRSGSSPNPWETAWVLWHYGDNTHFYYFIPKPNGWELGKEDPAYPGAQRFLAAGSAPSFAPGPWNTVRVRQVGNTITVWVDGNQVVSFTDSERPYGSGALGLYTEDAHVHFDNVRLQAP
jgi:hypothetical protein